MTAISAFLPEIRRGAKNCPEPTQIDAVRRAARRFCLETRFVKRTVSFDTVANVSQYELPVDTNEEIVELIGAQIWLPNGAKLPMGPLRSDYMNRNFGPGTPRWFGFAEPLTITVYPTPNKVFPIWVTVAVQPTADTTAIPEEVFRKYDRIIGYGALEWIMDMPGESWSNPAAAAKYMKQFSSGIANGKTEALRQSLPGNQRVNPRPFIV